MWVGRFFGVRSCLLITLIKSLKGHKSLGSLCSVVKGLIVSGVRRTDRRTDNESYRAVCGQLKTMHVYVYIDGQVDCCGFGLCSTGS